MPVPTSKCDVSYADVCRYRSEAPDGFLGFPVVCGRDELMASRLRGRDRLLEIGAGERPFRSELAGFTGTYRTMDVDPAQKHDFYSIAEIAGTFDGVVMREVAEHVPRDLFFEYIRKIYDVLSPGGVVVLSTPNPWSPWMWSDYTHIVAWPPRDMYAVLRAHGFEGVEIFRIIWPSRWLWLKKIYWRIHSSFYAIDYAGSYVAIGRKPTRENG